MPSSIAHGLTAAAIGFAFFPDERPRRVIAIAAVGAVLLDVDAVGRPFGLGDLAFLGGHRALTHSPVFALLLGSVIVAVAYRGSTWQSQQLRICLCLSLAFVAHGVLDAFTAYGEGVMFLAPFSAHRFKAPWLPFRGILPEIVGIWLPMAGLISYNRWRARSSSAVRAP
ncbi:MAG: metal-dependent hydrolase [Gemmatimonadota bacterium]